MTEIAIRVTNLSKCYQIYDVPGDRLKQFVAPRLQRLAGQSPKQYFREFWALKDVSFEIRKGESLGIIGRNGSGKSTLLQIICGTLTPTGGSIETNGRIAALLELGSGFNPEFTGRENVFLNSAIFGLSKEETKNRLEDIFSFADIGKFVDQPVKTYSSGMFVRLAFAVQASLDPDILIVDEALAVGDALFQKRCFERIEALISRGTTILFVSHDEESVRTLTQHAILLSEGRIVSSGTSSEVILDYRRRLHDQERCYLASLAKSHEEKAVKLSQPTSNLPDKKARPTDRFSFGDLEAEVIQVRVMSSDGAEQQVFYPTDQMIVEVICICHKTISHLNVALRLRNKEGIKIYSWGTLNQDESVAAGLSSALPFWSREFNPEIPFSVRFEFLCALGPNLYEIQAAISHEGKPYYAEQRILHWRDEAAFFSVATKPREYHFGGVTDLRMTATVQDIKQ